MTLKNFPISASRLAALFFAIGLLMLASGGEAAAFFKKGFPACSDEKVAADIIKRFNWAEENTWHRGYGMTGIDRAHQHSLDADEDAQIKRRYCHADAHLGNGKTRKLYFLIEDGQGLAGFGWKVEWCVVGLDPWRVHDGSCRVLRR